MISLSTGIINPLTKHQALIKSIHSSHLCFQLRRRVSRRATVPAPLLRDLPHGRRDHPGGGGRAVQARGRDVRVQTVHRDAWLRHPRIW